MTFRGVTVEILQCGKGVFFFFMHKSDFFFAIRGAGAGQERVGGEVLLFWAELHH